MKTMKKVVSLILTVAMLAMCAVPALASGKNLILSGTTKIEGTQTENRYARATDDEKNSGNYSLRIYSESAGFEFGQSYTVENLPAGEYTVTWYAKGNDGTMLFSNNWDEGVYNVHLTPEVQSNGWKKYTKVLTLNDSGNTKFLFYADTALDCYIDDISLVDANGTNYIIDGGFEEVEVAKYEVAEPTFSGLTADGKLQSGTIEVKTSVWNYEMGENFNPRLVVALYNGNEFVTLSHVNQTATETYSKEVPGTELSVTLDIPEVTENDNYNIKIMFWDGLTPLITPKSVD